MKESVLGSRCHEEVSSAGPNDHLAQSMMEETRKYLGLLTWVARRWWMTMSLTKMGTLKDGGFKFGHADLEILQGHLQAVEDSSCGLGSGAHFNKQHHCVGCLYSIGAYCPGLGPVSAFYDLRNPAVWCLPTAWRWRWLVFNVQASCLQ